MKRSIIVLTITIAIALIPGCKKGDGYIISQGPPELNNCPILQIIRNNFGDADTVVFTYNALGDPVSVTKVPGPFFESGYNGPNYAFTYDKKHRLAESIAFVLDTPQLGKKKILEQHKYFYDNPGNGNLTRDSAYYEPARGYNFRSLTYYIYDEYDRIIKDSTFGPEVFTPLVYTYTYDAKGNRASIKSDNHAGYVHTITFPTYDNKTNIHRTNKIWMFFDRDYSVNNRFAAASYNSKELPTETYHTQFELCTDTYYDKAQITYGCR